LLLLLLRLLRLLLLLLLRLLLLAPAQLLLLLLLLLLGCTCWLLHVGRNAQCCHHWAGCSNGSKHTCVAALSGAKQRNMLGHVAGLSSSSTCPVTQLDAVQQVDTRWDPNEMAMRSPDGSARDNACSEWHCANTAAAALLNISPLLSMVASILSLS
jgi:hypothetical protein